MTRNVITDDDDDNDYISENINTDNNRNKQASDFLYDDPEKISRSSHNESH